MAEDESGRWWTCKYCVKKLDWVRRDCYEIDMCRYSPEIYLIERGLLSPSEVKFGEWDPEYELSDGRILILKNKKQVQRCRQELPEKLKELETVPEDERKEKTFLQGFKA